MTMVMRTISVSQFKARCLSLFDEVEEGGAEFVVTRRGRPVARVVPVAPARPLLGSVEVLGDPDDLLAPIDVDWESSF